MKQEQKVYIELYVEKIVSMTVEAGYNVDKFGNIIYKDKSKTVEQLREALEDVSNDTNLSIVEIIDYLFEIYNKKINNPNFAPEYKEINSLLTIIKGIPEDARKTDKDKNNSITTEETR